jgi:transglutaminase-like putative cysteine protease
MMQIRLGYELAYDCPQPTPMLLTLNVHYTRISDIVVPDHLVTSPSIPIRAYRDGFGNWCNRIVTPAARTPGCFSQVRSRRPGRGLNRRADPR